MPPTLASLTRSLTLPLNRKQRQLSSPGADVDQPDISTATGPIEFSASRPPVRRNNSVMVKSSSNSNGAFNLNLNGIKRSNTMKSVKTPKTPTGESPFVVPAYVGPDNATPQGVVFGRPLKESLQYASVQISTANSNGELYVWGHIPVVVAKCGLYLKENATEVQGTFRVNGSNKRMRELQEAFETPPRYGKDLVWTEGKYNTHDVASVFRRYLTQMPEPVIPYELYHQFRDALAKEPYNQDEVIAKYKSLIRQMPRGNQYLLLYVLDLLSVFARKSDINLMTATNLAVIFRPGLLSHPEHEMVPQEHALSQKVLEFLIAHQDWFMLDVPPPPPRRGSQQQQPTGHERRGSEQHQHHGTSSSAPNPNSLQSTSHGASKTQPPLTPNSVTATAGHGSSTQHTVSNSSHSNGFGLSPIHAAPSSYHPPSQSRQPPSRFGLSSGRPLSDVGIEVDDVMVIPSGALEEQGGEFSSGVGGGGWRSKSSSKDKDKEREKEKERIKMMRRRTTMERSDLQNRDGSIGDVMTSPIPELDSPNGNGVTVQRSRTLPSSRRKDQQSHNASGELVLSSSTGTGKENFLGTVKEGKERRGLLLKKNRRISSNAVEKERTS